MEACSECGGGGEIGKQLDVDFWQTWKCEVCDGTGEVDCADGARGEDVKNYTTAQRVAEVRDVLRAATALRAAIRTAQLSEGYAAPLAKLMSHAGLVFDAAHDLAESVTEDSRTVIRCSRCSEGATDDEFCARCSEDAAGEKAMRVMADEAERKAAAREDAYRAERKERRFDPRDASLLPWVTT